VARDGSTAKHSASVAELVWSTARELGLSEHDAGDAAHIALVHDIGKVAIPDAILHKRGPLSESDWQIMRRHSEIGAQILAEVEALVHLAPAVRAEHERWDGKGYPDGLSADAIPPASRLVLACDAYDAMISDRPYRAALAPGAAIVELKANAGSQFDPEVVSALVGVVQRRGAYP
jgi:putative nucleotidyltransferase with HDIG domain